MKKIVAFGLVAAVGATVAFASSIGVPWFIDNAATNVGMPPSSGNLTLITLHNNLETTITCEVVYYTENGIQLIPTPKNTFVIPGNSSVQFRPVRQDPAFNVTEDLDGNPLTPNPRGQEGQVGVSIPDRPLGFDNGNDNKENGSCVISWDGGPNDVQGNVILIQTVPIQGQGGRFNNNNPLIISWSHLLPPGN